MARPNPFSLTREAADLLSAALRHARDAEHLLDLEAGHTSPDQAYHIAGFAPECARKATLAMRFLDLSIGHDFGAGAESTLDFALAIDPVAHRYDPLGYAARCPTLTRWTVDARYDRTGKRTAEEAATLCREVRALVDEVTVALWADGRLPDGAYPW